MNRRIALPLLVAAVAMAPTALAADTDARKLCFFSLNNVKEFELTHRFLEQNNPAGAMEVQSAEFHDPGRDPDPRSSFTGMIQSSPSCDGLVISGHHTGSFGGKRAKGVLDISFLEQLSCDAGYDEFFKGIKAVWLQGCRTLGVGELSPDGTAGSELEADYHMQRVGAELFQDGLEQSFAELSYEFSATLDQDNPLASRYLRVFPSATVFGWTRSSPGEQAGSELSLLYHMAHMTALANEIPPFDPLKVKSPRLRKNMSDSLWQTLGGGQNDSQLARTAWLNHGRMRQDGLGYFNPDLNAYVPLQRSSTDALLVARALGCAMRNAEGFQALQAALASILSSDTYVAYNFHAIWDVFRQHQQLDSAEYDELKKQFVASDQLMNLLHRKLTSARTGLLMKMEFYSFYRNLTGEAVPKVEAQILDRVKYFLLAQDLGGTEYDIRDFRESLLTSLVNNQLAEADFYLDVMQSPKARPDTLYAITWSFLKASPAGADSVIRDAVHHPLAGDGTLRGAALWILRHDPTDKSDLLLAIVENPRVDETALANVATALARYDIPQADRLAREIVEHPQANSLALNQISVAMYKGHVETDRALMNDIATHPSVDPWGLRTVARIALKSDVDGTSRLLWYIVQHPEANASVLSSVALGLGNKQYRGENQLLQFIEEHPEADERTIRYVERARARNAYKHRSDEDFL